MVNCKYDFIKLLEKQNLFKTAIRNGWITTTMLNDLEIYNTYIEKKNECDRLYNNNHRNKMLAYSVTAECMRVSETKVRSVIKKMTVKTFG